MSSIAFDTHAFVKCLTQAGMDEQQAEALVECQTQLINDSLATKLDIEEVKKEIAEVKREVETLRLEIKKDMKDLELRLIIRLGSIIVITIGVFATLIKLL